MMVFLFQHLGPGRYNGPEIAAQALATNFDAESRERVRILDVAAGTGRLGAEVHALEKNTAKPVLSNHSKDKNWFLGQIIA